MDDPKAEHIARMQNQLRKSESFAATQMPRPCSVLSGQPRGMPGNRGPGGERLPGSPRGRGGGSIREEVLAASVRKVNQAELSKQAAMQAAQNPANRAVPAPDTQYAQQYVQIEAQVPGTQGMPGRMYAPPLAASGAQFAANYNAQMQFAAAQAVPGAQYVPVQAMPGGQYVPLQAVQGGQHAQFQPVPGVQYVQAIPGAQYPQPQFAAVDPNTGLQYAPVDLGMPLVQVDSGSQCAQVDPGSQFASDSDFVNVGIPEAPFPDIQGVPEPQFPENYATMDPRLAGLSEAEAGGDVASGSEASASGRRSRKMYKCTAEDCGKYFNRRYNLKIHMRVHTGETPYECRYQSCSEKFMWRSSLKHHMRQHMREEERMNNGVNSGSAAAANATVVGNSAVTDQRPSAINAQQWSYLRAGNLAYLSDTASGRSSSVWSEESAGFSDSNVPGGGDASPLPSELEGLEVMRF